MLSDLGVAGLIQLFVIILFSMGLHEAMHGFVAHWLGDSTAHDAGRLTLNPLKHVDLFMTVILPVTLIAAGLPPIFAAKPVPFNPYRVKFEEFGAALIGLAGPLTNLALAIFASLLLRIFHPTMAQAVIDAVLIFIQVNVGFFVFNMIPIPPLDGSRLLYAVAPEPVQEFMARLEQGGLFLLFVILIVAMPVIGPIISGLNQSIVRVLLS